MRWKEKKEESRGGCESVGCCFELLVAPRPLLLAWPSLLRTAELHRAMAAACSGSFRLCFRFRS
jgi:hypothetical protein